MSSISLLGYRALVSSFGGFLWIILWIVGDVGRATLFHSISVLLRSALRLLTALWTRAALLRHAFISLWRRALGLLPALWLIVRAGRMIHISVLVFVRH